jgi:hypothetical protein
MLSLGKRFGLGKEKWREKCMVEARSEYFGIKVRCN